MERKDPLYFLVCGFGFFEIDFFFFLNWAHLKLLHPIPLVGQCILRCLLACLMPFAGN